MIRALHFSPFLQLTGANRSMLTLVGAQDGAAVVTLEDGPLAAEARARGARVFPVFDAGARERGKADRFARTVATLVRAARQTGAQVVHTHSAMGVRYALPAARIARLPLVAHQRDNWARDRFHLGLGFADRIVAIADWVRRGLPPRLAAKADVVHNAVAAPTELPPRRPGPVRIGMAGRCTPEKGQDLLVRACAALPGDVAFECHVWGLDDSAYAAELRRLAAAGPAGRFVFEPFRNDVDRFYEAMDVVVSPSRFEEPFGRTAIEGMAWGKAVVAAGHGGLVEIVRDGEDGLLFAPGSAEALAGALGRLLADDALRTDLGRAGRRAAIERFSPETHAEAIERTYRKVLSG